ncbi:hypothetical protein DCAR_0206765 [Daucus carota subsp. sativus]|uniref:Uncharacterized protein n=1 Tax=Daucus carota subsp. sativus TaxID=79200 RepID=A0A161X2E8_DAUCS|nr:hypothetical protein DCAR_0206765 [Daucus carota subsp. sativus]
MKWAYENQIPKVVVETDNIVAFQIFRHQDEEEDVIEAEELIEGSRTRNVSSPPSSVPEAAFLLSRYALDNCSSLVDAPFPVNDIREQLDIDAGFGPHREMLNISPNLGLGEVITIDGRVADNKRVEVITVEDDLEGPLVHQEQMRQSGIINRENSGRMQMSGRVNFTSNVPSGKGKEKMQFGSSSSFARR